MQQRISSWTEVHGYGKRRRTNPCGTLHHRAEPQTTDQPDHTHHRLHHRPAAEGLGDGKSEVFFEEPEAGIIDVAAGQGAGAGGEDEQQVPFESILQKVQQKAWNLTVAARKDGPADLVVVRLDLIN